MSHFACPYCNAVCYDSPQGYVTGCEHYPLASSLMPLHTALEDGVITVNNEYGCYQILMDFAVGPKTEEE